MNDYYGNLSSAQAVTSTGDTASSNVYDNGSAYNDMGFTADEDLWLHAAVSTTATSGGSATIQVVLQDSADNNSFADVVSGAAVAVANAVAGASLLDVKLPVGLRRYVRVAYRIGTAALTAGNFNSYIDNKIQRNVAKPSGFSVS
jgi:hypothetical protein